MSRFALLGLGLRTKKDQNEIKSTTKPLTTILNLFPSENVLRVVEDSEDGFQALVPNRRTSL